MSTGPHLLLKPTGPPPGPTALAKTAFGTMTTYGTKATTEYGAGLRVAMMEPGWKNYQPTTQGVHSASFVTSQQNLISTFKSAGLSITLGPAPHMVPSWFTAQPSSKLLYFTSEDVYTGADASKTSTRPNAVFSADVRPLIENYYGQLHADLGINNFDAIRIVNPGSNSGEVLYPQLTGSEYHYWAFDVAAQGHSPSKLASGMTACPSPGWIPGTTHPQGSAGVQAWADWYIDSLEKSLEWQMAYLVDQCGFTGWFEIVMPGSGVRPTTYSAAVAKNLPARNIFGVGAAWQRICAKLAASRFAPQVRAHCSSMGDGSGSNIPTQPGDAALSVTDGSCNSHGAMRWMADLARAYGFGYSGENTGYGSNVASIFADTSDAGMIALLVKEAEAANMDVVYFVRSANFYSATGGAPQVSLSNYQTRAAVVYNGAAPNVPAQAPTR